MDAPMNKYLVAGGNGKVSLNNPPRGGMTKEDALGLAAWLVVVAEIIDFGKGPEFTEVLEACRNT